ncbi:MAG: hypothetical protein RMK32_10285, partial [Anaerolineae bacterium]|nr:hypothetical protein [Anaerolineae bacterium]
DRQDGGPADCAMSGSCGCHRRAEKQPAGRMGRKKKGPDGLDARGSGGLYEKARCPQAGHRAFRLLLVCIEDFPQGAVTTLPVIMLRASPEFRPPPGAAGALRVVFHTPA